MVVGLLAVQPTAASARTLKSGTMTFQATPCAIACSYNLKDADRTGGQRFDACEAPAPEGSFDDVILKAPTGARILTLTITPEVEWDLFLCSKPTRGNNGKLIAKNLNKFWECPAACPETFSATVSAGRSYVVRAFNVWDPADLPGRYWFKS
jgi:hypothetical protein